MSGLQFETAGIEIHIWIDGPVEKVEGEKARYALGIRSHSGQEKRLSELWNTATGILVPYRKCVNLIEVISKEGKDFLIVDILHGEDMFDTNEFPSFICMCNIHFKPKNEPAK